MSFSFLSKSNPLVSNVKKGKFLTPWFLAPFILYYITQYMSPISTASTNFFLNKQSWIPDWWNGSFVLPLHHHRLLPLGETH